MHDIRLTGIRHQHQLYIGGSWVAPRRGGSIDLYSPATEQFLGCVAEASQEDVDATVTTAERAFREGPWPRMAPAERAAKLRALGAKVQERLPQFAHAWTLQVGLPFHMAEPTTAYFADFIEFVATTAERMEFEEVRVAASGESCVVVHEPVGVCVCVVPWNAPLVTLLLKVIPALAAGCTVIAKPAPETPLEALMLAECIDEVGLPEGVFSVLPAGREVSDYLVRQPQVDKVSFTGSTAVGLHIASLCGARSARVVTELGGKSAAIVLDDAPADVVVAGIIPNLVTLSGQQCAAFSRILVPRSREREIVDALSAAMAGMPIGDPYDSAVALGPLVAQRQLARVTEMVSQGVDGGARIAAGGGRTRCPDEGWFYEPTLLTDVDNGMPIARNEIFGPVGCVIAYDEEDEAVRIANDSHYGLSGCVFTPDTDRAYAIARRIRTGNFTQNGRVIDFTLPYGGFKQSGIGREGGVEGLKSFCEIKAVFLPRPPSHLAG